MRFCQCSDSEVEPLECSQNVTRCKTCGGVFAMRVSSFEELEKIREELNNYGGTD